MSALDKQVGGGHYKGRGIQPVEYIHANKLDFFQGAVVKYITRWRDKDGLKDLEKCKHFLEMYIELETKALETRPEITAKSFIVDAPSSHPPGSVVELSAAEYAAMNAGEPLHKILNSRS